MTTRIVGTGSYLPELIVSNDDLANIVETNDEWISSRTGIKERRLVKEETTVTMAREAANLAMKDGNIAPEEIDLIIVATMTPDMVMPSAACQVQNEIQAVNAVAFDVNGACSGFLFALNTAHAYIKSGIYKNALVIGTETLSKILDWNDRKTCVLFGDGAGAVVVKEDTIGIDEIIMGSDGSKGDALTCGYKPNHHPFIQDSSSREVIWMDGQEVFKFAVKKVPETIEKLLIKSGTNIDQIKYFILHQANSRIIQSVGKRLKVSEDKFPMNLSQCGNTSAASIPILLDEINKEGIIKKGDKVVLSGFGGGLTWGALQMTW